MATTSYGWPGAVQPGGGWPGAVQPQGAAPGGFQAAWAAGCNAVIVSGVFAMRRNVGGQKVGAQMVSAADGSAFTGAVTVAVTGDAGTQAAGSVGAGACTHEGGGYHTYAPAQAETDYDLIAFTFTGAGAIPVTVQVYTLPTTGVLAPATAGRTLTVEADGMAHADTKEVQGVAASDAIRDATHDGQVLYGTVESTGTTTTNIVIKTLDVTLTDTDQLKGRVLLFKKDTATVALRGQGAPVDGSTTTAITLAAGDALTAAPQEDDVFSIV